jgi:hypothetical protein
MLRLNGQPHCDASARTLRNFNCLLVPISYQIYGKYTPQTGLSLLRFTTKRLIKAQILPAWPDLSPTGVTIPARVSAHVPQFHCPRVPVSYQTS